MKHYLTHLFILVALSISAEVGVLAQAPEIDRIWLDAVLEPTNKRKAVYYLEPAGGTEGAFKGRYNTIEGKLKAEGSFADEALTIEHGVFTFYHDNGKVESTGRYEHGRKAGLWKRYDLWSRPLADKVYDPNALANIIYTQAPTMPKYSGGDERALVKYIQEQVAHGPGRVKGRVMTSFVVEKDGQLSDVKVDQAPDGEMEQQLVDVLRSTAPWTPGEEKGQPVRVRMQVPVKLP